MHYHRKEAHTHTFFHVSSDNEYVMEPIGMSATFFQVHFPCISPVAVETAAGLMVTGTTQMDRENEKGMDCFSLMFILHLSAIICSLFLLEDHLPKQHCNDIHHSGLRNLIYLFYFLLECIFGGGKKRRLEK